MNERNAKRLLLIAFAVSILVHFLGVRFVHWSIATPVEPPDKLTVSHIVVVRIARRTPPPRTPQPLQTPRVAPKHVTPLVVPHAVSQHGAGSQQTAVATTAARPTPTPVPVRSALPSASPNGCVTPNAPAALREAAPVPEIPLAARQSAKVGIAQVRVRLSELGAVLDASVQAGTGSDALDQVAVDIAKSSTYTAALAQCKATVGFYVFRVKFETP